MPIDHALHRAQMRYTRRRVAQRIETKQQRVTAAGLGGGLAYVDGLPAAISTDVTGAIEVINRGQKSNASYKTVGEVQPGGVGGCGGGEGGVGVHELAGGYHTGILSQSQAPWAATALDLEDHVADFILHAADPDAHHDRKHYVTSADDHEVVAARYSVLGTPTAANTLGMWLTDEDGTPGNVLLRSDSDGNARLNALFAYDKVQSQSYASGFGGNGYRLDYGVTNSGKATLEVDDLSVRRRMTVRELLIRKIRTTNGDIFVSSGGEVATATDLGGGSWRLTFKEDHGFLEDDLIAAQAWTGSGVYRLEMTVTAVADTKTLTATLDDGGGDTPGSVLAAGLSLSFARHGNETDADRQGVIYLSSDDTGAPFIRVLDGIDSWAKWGAPDTLKVQMGKLGISHAVLGNLPGYGLFGENVFLTGTMVAGGGDVALNDDGVMLKSSGSGGSFTDTAQNITWIDDVMATPAWDNISGQILSRKYGTSTIWNKVQTLVYSGETTGINTQTDAAGVELTAYYLDGATTGTAQVRAEIENGAAQIWLTADNSDNTGGEVIVAGGGSSAPVVLRPANDLGGTLGEALTRWKTIYADELVVGTTYTENTGYVNDTRYYPRAELNSYLSGNFAAIDHTHAGHITATELTAELADYASIAYVDAEIAAIPAPDLSNYWTKTQADGRYTQATTYNGHVAAANPHGTALADLTARDYDDLTNREHLLADAVGLGPDHTISGATVGHVLRATDTDAARFMQLSFSDLGGSLAYSDLTDRTHNVVSEHSVTADQYSVLGTWAGANTLGMETASSDGTVAHTLLMSGDNGELSLRSIGGYNGILRVSDVLESTNFDADSALGWQLGPTNQILSNATITGSMTAAVFEFGSTVVGASEQLFTAGGGGKMAAAVTINTNTTDDYTISVDDPKLGHMQIAEVGEIFVIRGLAYDSPESTAEGATVAGWEFLPTAASSTPAQLIREIWAEVRAVTDQTTHYDYDIRIKTDRSDLGHFTFPAGTAIANLGDPADDVGGIKITSAPGVGPYLSVWSLGEAEGVPYQTQHMRIGKLSSLWFGNDGEWGLATGKDLTSGPSWSPYAILSNQRLYMNNVDQNFVDLSGNTTLKITAASGLDMFYDREYTSGRDRRISWVGDDDETEYFNIGPDDAEKETFSIWTVLQDDFATLHLAAGPERASWPRPYYGEDPRYAGIQLNSFNGTPNEGENASEKIYSSIVVYAGRTTFYSTLRIRGLMLFDSNYLPNTSDDLDVGSVYVDSNGFLKVVQ